MKDVNSLKGIHGLKTMQSTKKRSIPGFYGSNYLDLYMLEKEKDRLLKENETLCVKRDAIKKRLKEIDLEINKLQDVSPGSSGRVITQKDEKKGKWKKMPVNY